MRGNGERGGGVMIPFFCNGAEIPQMNINFFGLFNFGIFGKKPGNFRCRKVKRKFLKVISWKSNNS